MPYIDPDREAWQVFKTLPKGQAINMLNLIRLKPRAEYPEGHPDHGKELSGLDAYRAYGRTSAEVFARVGGRQVWVGKPQVMVTGPGAEAWDLAFMKHRTAGVADSRLMCLTPTEPGEGFGE